MRVLVADSCEAIQLGIQSIVNKSFIGSQISAVSEKDALFEKIDKVECDVVVVEPLMCRDDSHGIISKIKHVAPNTSVLVFTYIDEKKFGVQALRDGASGYLMKNCSPRDLISALIKVHLGEIYISGILSEEIAFAQIGRKRWPPHDELSDREVEIFSLLVKGWKLVKIAGHCGISVKTVSSHKARILTKLRCTSLSQLIQYAIVQKLTLSQ